MKTPIQELIERLEYLIGLAEGTMYEIGLKSAKEQAEAMLEKEEDYHQRMIEIVAQELHNLGMPTDRAIDQAAFESSYGYSDTNYNSFKEGVKWVIEQLKTFNTKEK